MLSLLLAAGCSNHGSVSEAGSNKTAANSAADTAEGNTASPLDCDWTMHVDDTVTKSYQGMQMDFTLILLAKKNGGSDELGTYKGKAYLFEKTNVPSMGKAVGGSAEGYQYSEGRDDNVQFDVIKYDVNKFSEFGQQKGAVDLAPLVKYDSMALYTTKMSWSADWNILYHDDDDSGVVADSYSDMANLPMKIAVEGGQVSVTILMHGFVTLDFKGIVTGDPAQSRNFSDDAAGKLNEFDRKMKQARQENAKGGNVSDSQNRNNSGGVNKSSGGSSSASDLMGQMGVDPSIWNFAGGGFSGGDDQDYGNGGSGSGGGSSQNKGSVGNKGSGKPGGGNSAGSSSDGNLGKSFKTSNKWVPDWFGGLPAPDAQITMVMFDTSNGQNGMCTAALSEDSFRSYCRKILNSGFKTPEGMAGNNPGNMNGTLMFSAVRGKETINAVFGKENPDDRQGTITITYQAK